MISCHQICKYYPTSFLRRNKKIALDCVSFHVEHNEIFGIIGLNGAGKSSLLKILMGFIKADGGSALIAGTPAGTITNRHLIGYLPEHPSLYPNLTITEHLQFASHIGGLSNMEAKKRIQNLLESVEITEVAKVPIRRFSKGMTQRAALAYAILLEPEILILDEPMSGLDPLGRQIVIDIVQEYRKKGHTVLFCSHILNDVERICDRIGIMHHGNLDVIVTTPISINDSYKNSHLKDGKTPLESLFLQTVKAKNQ